MLTAAQNGAIEVFASRYGGFEQVGSLPQSFSRNDVQTTTQPGDIYIPAISLSYSSAPIRGAILDGVTLKDFLLMN